MLNFRGVYFLIIKRLLCLHGYADRDRRSSRTGGLGFVEVDAAASSGAQLEAQKQKLKCCFLLGGGEILKGGCNKTKFCEFIFIFSDSY